MNDEAENEAAGRDDPWDHAVAARLARLRTMPVDLSGLEARLRDELPRPRAGAWAGRLRPARAVAAAVLLVGLLAAVFVGSSGGPVMAEARQMAQVHDDMVAGRVPSARVDSIADANRVLTAQWPQSPALPGVPREHVMACCMKSVKGKRVACLLMERDGTPVTMTVASAADVKVPDAPAVTRGGTTYYVQSVGDLQMVMTEQHERWVCLIGKMPADRLMDLAGQLQF